MADSKISALPAVTTPASSDEIPVNQGGTTKKVTIDQLPDGVRKVMASGSNVPVFDGEERSVVDRLTMAGTARLALAGTGRQIIESRVYVPGYIEATQRYPSDILPIHQSGVLKRIQIATLQGARTSFVAPNGSDSTGDGSMMRPWATIAKWVGQYGIDAAPGPGDTLFLRGGTYTAPDAVWIGRHDSGVDTNELYGTAAQPIRIMAYPGESPVFTGGSQVFISIARATWLVVDGITIRDRRGVQSGYITTGQWPAGGPWGPADNITVRNCTLAMSAGVAGADVAVSANTAASPTVVTTAAHGKTGTFAVTISGSNSTPPINGTWTATYVDATHFTVPVAVSVAGTAGTCSVGDNGFHPIYATTGTHNLTVERCTLIGPGSLVYGDGGFGVQVYEGFRDAPHGTTIRNCVFDGWNQGGVAMYGGTESPNPDGEIVHNTFRRCRTNIRLGPHEWIVVRDNYGDAGLDADINDDTPAKTVADHNYWTVSPSGWPTYAPPSGSAAIGGAADGGVAGAFPLNDSGRTYDILGSPRRLVRPFVIPPDYAHDVIGRLEMYGSLRGAIQGTGELILSDDFKTRGRVVLAGRGG